MLSSNYRDIYRNFDLTGGYYMAAITRNALKGYVYQNYIFTLFLAKMDTERVIKRIESEAETTGNFDDIYVSCEDKSYRIQVKNYADATIDDIEIAGNKMTIKNNVNYFCPSDNNVVVVNTSKIATNTTFMGFDAVKKDGIIIVPLPETLVAQILDEIFKSEERELQIILLGQKLTSSSRFVVKTEDLPDLVRISVDLENQTILLRDVINIEKGITYIVGRPGVGKSHYVNEIKKVYQNAIVYRFWTSSQDDNINKRLLFDNFIEDLGVAVFNNSKNFSLQEIIDEINSKELTIIIDGLDHVENYNPTELSRYIEFINAINLSKVVVLSRPLKTDIAWKVTELGNWSFDELYLYLSYAYEITNYSLAEKIYSVSDGYPIITYYLAEHYKLTGEINIDCQLSDINQYYDELMSSVDIKTPLTLFATNNSFFIMNELEELLGDAEMVLTTKEFISCFPYLFKQTLNRCSLIHDSLNTYLKSQLKLYSLRRKSLTEKVKESLLSGEVRYMSRLMSFDFDEDFFDDLLRKYSDFSMLNELLKKTIDFDSIREFYNQLQLILEKRDHVLNVYQLYSFALIHQCVNRNNLIGFDEVVYQIILYMQRFYNVEDLIFSSGVIWNLYVMLKTNNTHEYKRFLTNNHYGSEDIDDIYEKIKRSQLFFEPIKDELDFDRVTIGLRGKTLSELDKRDLLISYLLKVWINKDDNLYYDAINTFLYENEDKGISKLVKLTAEYNIERMWISSSLYSARYRLHELGYFDDNNMFRRGTLKEFIMRYASKGSFEIMHYMESFLRLANYEKRIVDICSINFAWIMHYMRKDYSVFTLNKALIVFENLNLIDSSESIQIISSTMEQSEKGIRLLLTTYINLKSTEFTLQLIRQGFFDEERPISFVELDSKHIDCFEEPFVQKQIIKLLKCHGYSKTIEFRDIEQIILSSYCDMLCNYLYYNGFTIINVYDESSKAILNKYKIEFKESMVNDQEEYVPFEHDCIHESDREYIVENNLPHMELACYTDGWYSSFPYVDLYLLYDQDLIRADYLTIIHKSMFARTPTIQSIGNWSLLLGNIPAFLAQSKVNVDWHKLYDIFSDFIEVSLITNVSIYNEN